MAIGTTAAILGSAVLGAGASALSSRNNSRAISASTDAQTQSNAQSLALQSNIYNQNSQTLAPYVNRGNTAGNAINDLLGLSQPQAPQQPNALAQFRGGPSPADYYGVGDGSMFGYNPARVNDIDPQTSRFSGLANALSSYGGGIPSGGTFNQNGTQATPIGQGQQQNVGVNGNDAFQTWLGNSNYAFDMGNGSNAINSGYAGAGTLQSGAAMKGLEDYRQNLQNGYRGEFMGYLGQQQGTGLQAAGAQAGVGVNYANSASQINQQNANALSNAAVARANNSNALIGGITSGIGSALGGFGR